MRTIYTGLEGKVNYNILASLEGQLSDGIWENVSQMNKYWEYMNTKLNEKDEVVIEIGEEYCEGGFANKDVKWIKKWLANKIKQIVKIECEDHNEEFNFKESNEKKVRYMRDYYYEGNSPKVSDVYKAYKTLIK